MITINHPQVKRPSSKRTSKKHNRRPRPSTVNRSTTLTPSLINFSPFLNSPFLKRPVPQPPAQLIQQEKPLSELVGDLIAEIAITAGRVAWKKASPETFNGYQLLTGLATSPNTPPEFKGWLNGGAFLVFLQGGCDTALFIRKELRRRSR